MMKGMLLCSRGSWRYQRNRLGAAQEILLVSRPVGLELVIFLKETKRNRPVRASSHTRYFFSFLFFRAPHSTVSLKIDYFSSNPERCTDFDAPVRKIMDSYVLASYVVVPQ